MTANQPMPVFHDHDNFEKYVLHRLSSNLVLSDAFLMIIVRVLKSVEH